VKNLVLQLPHFPKEINSLEKPANIFASRQAFRGTDGVKYTVQTGAI